jgi:SAM-dependent methyltransferase
VSDNFFDEKAATWDDDPAKSERARRAAVAIREAIPVSPTDRLLEYGAGTGLVSQELQPFVGQLTLADSSEGMRDVMTQKVAAGVLEGARIWNLDLDSEAPPAEAFDLVVTVMVMHHVNDIALVVSRFNDALAPGGHLCVVDLEAEDGSYHGDDFHGHHGFETDAFAGLLREGGFADVTAVRYDEMLRDGRPFPLFLATGTKP